jgi:hypothetical protein
LKLLPCSNKNSLATIDEITPLRISRASDISLLAFYYAQINEFNLHLSCSQKLLLEPLNGYYGQNKAVPWWVIWLLLHVPGGEVIE